MYGIVDIAGTQFKLQEGDRVRAPRMNLGVGQRTQLSNVLLWSKDDGIAIGRPFLTDVAVNAKVLAHGRDKKVIVFKMRRRKGYRRKNGHRQGFTELLIEGFVRPGELGEEPAGADVTEEPVAGASRGVEEGGAACEETAEIQAEAAEVPALQASSDTEETQRGEAEESEEPSPAPGKNENGGE